MQQLRLGVIGDLHTHWDDIDVAQLNGSAYDLLFFTGDLGGGTPQSSLRIARDLSRLTKPTLVMPGNNDTVDIDALAAELTHRTGMAKLSAMKQGESSAAGGQAQLCGYSVHATPVPELDLTLVAARPHSMGGPELSFPDYMRTTYGIASMQDSTDRLVSLVDAAQTSRLIFLAHNGPTGLGAEPEDMWGCDFKPGGGDWGDPDLTTAIDYARQQQREVLAVVGGHMHLRTKSGALRPWQAQRDATLYVNAARVPRIFSGKDDVYRHHVALSVDAAGVTAEEVVLAQYGS